MPELKNITGDEELAWWMGLKALGWSIANFTWLIVTRSQFLEGLKEESQIEDDEKREGIGASP